MATTMSFSNTTVSSQQSCDKPINPAVVVQLKRFRKKALKIIPSDPAMDVPEDTEAQNDSSRNGTAKKTIKDQ